MTPRRRDSAGVSNLLEDSLLDLTDPHAGQSVDLTDLLKGVRTVLRRDHDAIVSFRVRNPVLAALSLTINAGGCLNGKARSAVHHLRRITLNDF